VIAMSATGLVGEFNAAGVLDSGDVHFARRVATVCGESEEQVLLAAAFVIRALRQGSVCVDLSAINKLVLTDSEELIDVSQLPWPDPQVWYDACLASPMIDSGLASTNDVRPLRLAHGLLYLDRSWRQEETVRSQIVKRITGGAPDLNQPALVAALKRLFPDPPADRQRLATAVGALSLFTVIAGGPGTGKTTTVARLIATLKSSELDTQRPLRIAVAAPTGKAAARLTEAVRSAAQAMSSLDQAAVQDIEAQTVHRLLGARFNSFTFGADNHLPHDVVIVDEASMVSLGLMARLFEATRSDARLILIGDPDQLASVEAGAVLGDIVRSSGEQDDSLTTRLRAVVPHDIDEHPVFNGVVTLNRPWRFASGGAIAELAVAIETSAGEQVVEVLRSGQTEVEFVEQAEIERRQPMGLERLRADVIAAAVAMRHAAQDGDSETALKALERHRLLCAHRRGPYGVQRWSDDVARWLQESDGIDRRRERWYAGQPLLINENNQELGLFNGDTGVVLRDSGRLRAAFFRKGQIELFSPELLPDVSTVYVMTVHKSQGSQFDAVSLVMPPVNSPLLTREMFYTAVTRAKSRVRVIGSAESVNIAVTSPANRASGLRGRLSYSAEPCATSTSPAAGESEPDSTLR